MKLIMILCYLQTEPYRLLIKTALKYFTIVCNVVSVFVKGVVFSVVRVDNFCEYEVITMQLIVVDEKDAICFVFNSEWQPNLSIWVLSDILIVLRKGVV